MTQDARSHLEQVVLPFWIRQGIDLEHGGFHTCFDNRGRTRVADDKYTWSQGRFIWLLAHAAGLAERGKLAVPGVDAERALDLARRGAVFLRENALRFDGTCAFALTRDGSQPVVGQPVRSVYADLFAAMGFAEYARVSGERDWIAPARGILLRAIDDIRDRTAPTPPYAVPAGHRAFGPRLILLNALGVFTAAERAIGASSTLDVELSHEIDAVMSFRTDDGAFAEMPRLDGRDGDDLITRHRVPGHALEAIWIVLDAIVLAGGDAAAHRTPALDSIAPLCELGWDSEFGGMLRYVDRSGGKPRGASGDTDYEQLVHRTWDTKLWWVHSEAAATTAIGARRHGRAECEPWRTRIWDYALSTFPRVDEGSEWVQIRNRDGSPLDQVVALPVKDPFHITRNLMQLIELDDESPQKEHA
ncbi:AGE family epimerase/isomerase [Microbacterium sp. H1-D42]|uniref:AGE family epimerase/isomerase n=1 Tax=Microbacterium sp. H1-D42 TaxID=2925844 RepID=UPI001F53897C|nr:AGE family epimerase/isomerase [Microbacterium sp. H1-D42]UNK70700.1 AGE family epimerase/isomerase [Microbacterium sp. H1-D42]